MGSGEPFFHRGYEYVAKEQTSTYKYDLGAIFSQTEDLIGRPPFEVMKFDSAAFTKLVNMQDNAVVKKALKQLQRDRREVSSTCVKVSKKVAAKVVEIESAESEQEQNNE